MMTSTPTERALAAFERAFDRAPSHIARAPGRVNLIGEHTDYNDGFVLPCAIEAHTAIAARPTVRSEIRVVAADFNAARDRFPTHTPITPLIGATWENYVRGVASAFADAGLDISGCDIAIAGNIPQGAGLSSSAALEVGMAHILDGYAAPPLADPIALAKLAQAAENDFVGVKCGLMDQLASACGQAGHALLIDCRNVTLRAVPLPENMRCLILHSGVRRGLVDGAYNTRRAQCEAVAEYLGVAALRDVDLATLEANRMGLDREAYRRARHVITENSRTLAAADALAANDAKTLGRLMAESHQSMAHDFDITTPEIDRLVALLQDEIGDTGGARMTGGGFGGCVVALLPEDAVDRVTARIVRDYYDGDPGLILSGRPSDGAQVMARK